MTLVGTVGKFIIVLRGRRGHEFDSDQRFLRKNSYYLVLLLVWTQETHGLPLTTHVGRRLGRRASYEH